MLSAKPRNTVWPRPSAHPITQPPTRFSSPSPICSFPPRPPVRHSSSPPLSHFPAEPGDPIVSHLNRNSDKLNDADQQVKLALIDLLNCTSIKSDHEVRMWVQKRLMDTEQKLKERRRSRLCRLAN